MQHIRTNPIVSVFLKTCHIITFITQIYNLQILIYSLCAYLIEIMEECLGDAIFDVTYISFFENVSIGI